MIHASIHLDQHASPRSNSGAVRGYAFTLIEVMFSILFLGLGLVAVASLFPLAGTIQQNTLDDIKGLQIAATADAYLRGRGVDQATLINQAPSAAITNRTVFKPSNINALIPMADRSFPSTEPDLAKRSYYWVPLFRYVGTVPPNPLAPAKPRDWEVYYLVLRATRDRPALGGDTFVTSITHDGNAPTLQANGAPLGRAMTGDYVIDPRNEIELQADGSPRITRLLTDRPDGNTVGDTGESRWHAIPSGGKKSITLNVGLVIGEVVR